MLALESWCLPDIRNHVWSPKNKQDYKDVKHAKAPWSWGRAYDICMLFRMGRGIESRSFSFFYSFPNARRNVSLRKGAATKRVGRERRDEEEEPAGVSGKRVSSRPNAGPRGLMSNSGLVSGRSICRKKMVRFEGD